MSWIIAVGIFWFVLSRLHGRLWSRRFCLGPAYVGRGWREPGRRTRFPDRPDVTQVRARPLGAADALEALKRRYVAGELTDEQYEAGLDELFRKAPQRGQA